MRTISTQPPVHWRAATVANGAVVITNKKMVPLTGRVHQGRCFNSVTSPGRISPLTQLTDQRGEFALAMNTQFFIDDTQLLAHRSHAGLALLGNLLRGKAIGNFDRNSSLGLGEAVTIVQELSRTVTADITADNHQY